MEVLDLYKPEYVKTNQTVLRHEAVPEGYCTKVIFVCVFDSEGKMLIQQRHPDKSWGGLWDVSAGGHVTAGESSEEAAVRELKEELGIEIKEYQLQKLMSLYYPQGIHDIFSTTIEVETDTLQLQKEEVAAAKWATREEIQEMIQNKTFIPVYKEFIELLFQMKTTQGIVL